jgi:uncharacterized protein
MLRITPTNDGVSLCVKAQTGARRRGITGIHGGALKVAVSEPPEKGKANRAIIKVLCDALCLRAAQIDIRSGEISKQKKLIVHGVTVDELQRRVTEALARES